MKTRYIVIITALLCMGLCSGCGTSEMPSDEAASTTGSSPSLTVGTVIDDGDRTTGSSASGGHDRRCVATMAPTQAGAITQKSAAITRQSTTTTTAPKSTDAPITVQMVGKPADTQSTKIMANGESIQLFPDDP